MACRFWAIVVVLFVPFAARAGDHWPAWRGPLGNGHSDEKNLPLTWGGKEQANILWKATLFPDDNVKRDQNQSSPIVWGDRAFVTFSYWPPGTTDKDFPEHHVACFNARTGEKLWDTTVLPGPWKLTDLRGGYTAPTPATDGERVYAVFGSAVIAALDGKGKIVWRHEIKPHHFDVAWGASPIVHITPKPAVQEGPGVARTVRVIVVCDHIKSNKSSTIYAFDGPTGKVSWEAKRPTTDWAHSTPLLASVNGKEQLLTATHNGPQGLDPLTGEVLWYFTEPKQVGDTVTPTYRDGVLYVDSGRGSMGIAVDATGKGDVSKTHLKWKIPSVGSGFSSPVLVGDYLYRLNGSDVVSCWKWATGEEVFKERLEGIDTSISPIATADGRIYVAGANKSYVLSAGPKLQVLGSSVLGDPSRSSPAIAGGRIYLKGGRYLWCVAAKAN